MIEPLFVTPLEIAVAQHLGSKLRLFGSYSPTIAPKVSAEKAENGEKGKDVESSSLKSTEKPTT